jgi:diaminohydroxyphosphoribosylaminopyrimidine deaminase/5-amino-6-(5-phosphoribosylamino)uracil reductase
MRNNSSKQKILDEQYMRRAVLLALYGKGKTSPNPMVGAVIVKNNKVVSEGWHKHCGSDHAEIDAIKKYKGSFKGATLYVTLEPCSHFGRTPPCVDAILEQSFSRIVIGLKDPNPQTNGKSIARLKNNGIKVHVGVFKNEIEKINEAFVTYMTQKRPLIVAKCAQTLDGKIATSSGDSQWITADSTRQRARHIRDGFDAIMVGVNTVLKDNPQLSGVQKSSRLKKIVVDSTLRTPLQARLFKNTIKGQCLIGTTSKAAENKIRLFEKRGVDIIVCPQKNHQVDLKWFLRELAEREITSVLIEGGAHLIGSFLKEGLVDKIHIYIAPLILGDAKALSSIVGLKIPRLSRAIRLKDWNIQKLNPDVLIEAYVHRNR